MIASLLHFSGYKKWKILLNTLGVGIISRENAGISLIMSYKIAKRSLYPLINSLKNTFSIPSQEIEFNSQPKSLVLIVATIYRVKIDVKFVKYQATPSTIAVPQRNANRVLMEHSVTINNAKKLAIIVCTQAKYFVVLASNSVRNAGSGTVMIAFAVALLALYNQMQCFNKAKMISKTNNSKSCKLIKKSTMMSLSLIMKTHICEEVYCSSLV